MRKILIVTGTRADYGIYSSIFKAIRNQKSLELEIVAAGMHLISEFGNTLSLIENDGFTVTAKIKVPYNTDTKLSMAKNVGAMTTKFSDILAKLKPDILMILGDRGEMLAAATAAVYLGVPVAHIHGGEVSGTVDEVARHAITKLSHIHFAATKKSAKRIENLGERPENIFVVGAPSLDTIINRELPNAEKLSDQLDFNVLASARPVVIVQHPVTSQIDQAGNQIDVTLKVIKETGLPAVIIYPNSDAGGRAMIKVIKSYRDTPNFHIYESLPHVTYLGLLREAAVLVGNSSSGIIEAPLFKLPVVNIGTRQDGRERSANVIDVKQSAVEIKKAVAKAITDNSFKKRVVNCKSPYGRGTAGVQIADILAAINLDEKLINKRITY